MWRRTHGLVPGDAPEGGLGRRAGGGEAALRVLGIDPGIATCGFGVIERGTGGPGRPVVLEYGALHPKGSGDPARLRVLYAEICRLVERHRPDAAAVERLFHTRNVSTAASVGQARGVVLLALAQAGVPIGEYTPTEAKLAVAGYGRADKAQMQAMVATQLGLAAPPRPDDAADALGLCLCHLLGQGLRDRLLAAGEAPAGELRRAGGTAVIGRLEALVRAERHRRPPPAVPVRPRGQGAGRRGGGLPS